MRVKMGRCNWWSHNSINMMTPAAVGTEKRKRSTSNEDAASKKKKTTAQRASAKDEQAIDLELKRVNDLLQKEETSQKRT